MTPRLLIAARCAFTGQLVELDGCDDPPGAAEWLARRARLDAFGVRR